jgi:hypothetical protein
MFAKKLKGKITRDHRLVVHIPEDLALGDVEVILLRTSHKSKPRRTHRRVNHPAFGIWAKRADVGDTSSFAEQVRRRVEQRADGNH